MFVPLTVTWTVLMNLYYVSGPGNISITLLSMEDQKTCRFDQKYLNLCSERRSYGFGTTWGWAINYRFFFIFRQIIEYRKEILVLFCKKKRYMPSWSEESDLNAPDVIITTSQLINTNFPGRLEHNIKHKVYLVLCECIVYVNICSTHELSKVSSLSRVCGISLWKLWAINSL